MHVRLLEVVWMDSAPQKTLFRHLKLVFSSLGSKVILCAYYVLVHIVNMHRCTLGFWKWFRWIQHPKKTLSGHLKLVCSSIGSKLILRAYYMVVHTVKVHRCTLGFWKWFKWIQHTKNKPKWLTVAMPLLKTKERLERDGAMADGLTYTNKRWSKA